MMNKWLILPVLAVVLVLAACSNDDYSDLAGSTWQAQIDEGDVLSAERHYNTVGIALSGLVPAGATITLSTDADWLTIDSDTLPTDGIFDVLPEANERGTTREATLTLTCQADGSQRQVTLTQEADDGSNADADVWHIGQGFSCFDEYMSKASLRNQVINVAKLQKLDSLNGVESVQDAMRGEEDLEVYTARSLVEMQSVLTKTTETKVNALFYKKTVKRFTQVSTHSTSEQCYSYARINRVVGSRTMDEGNLRYLLHDKDLIRNGSLPFTKEFYEAYRKITRATDETKRAQFIREMLKNYGTHIVVQASVGGAIDLVVCYQRDSMSTLTETAESVSRKVFGRSSSSSSSSSESSVTSSFAGQGAITISGGSKEARTALEGRVKNLSVGGSLSGKELDNWISTITSSAMTDSNKQQNLGVVSFHFIPIWDVFADRSISLEVMAEVVTMADQEKNTFSDEELGIDNYQLPLTPVLLNFSASPESTLVRLVYATPEGKSEAVPVAEVCNEYVPTVRADRRITVIYPIVNGTTRITHGIFPGDGEGNRPAWLAFGGSDVYVSPIDGYGPTDKLNTIYYLHGSLYPPDIGVKPRPAKLTTQDHYMTFWNGPIYPVVKIGSAYWTRKNMCEKMEFGSPFNSNDPDGEYYTYERVIKSVGILYANIFCGNSANFRKSYPGLFDDETDALGYRLHWYVPRVADLTALQTFLGGHCKSLFAKQQSGFEAQFVGYYGSCDDLNGGSPFGDGEKLRYKGQQCFVAAKDNSKEGAVLIISPNYTLRQVQTDSLRDNWYPVRPCRTSRYKYSNQ